MKNYNKNNYDLWYENLCVELAKHDPEDIALLSSLLIGETIEIAKQIPN